MWPFGGGGLSGEDMYVESANIERKHSSHVWQVQHCASGNKPDKITPKLAPPSKPETIWNGYDLKTQPELLVRYCHVATGFNSDQVTWLVAIENGHYRSWPGLTEKTMQKKQFNVLKIKNKQQDYNFWTIALRAWLQCSPVCNHRDRSGESACHTKQEKDVVGDTKLEFYLHRTIMGALQIGVWLAPFFGAKSKPV